MELPIDLQKLEPVLGAFDVIRYLATKNGGASDEDIMDDLDMSSRRFDKAKRRLVTTGYIQMRSDYVYELTTKGQESAEIIAAYDAEGGKDAPSEGDKLQRQVVIALPRNLVLGQTSPLQIAFEPKQEFSGMADLVVRLQAMYADIGDWNEMLRISSESLIVETTIAPQNYNQARLRLEVMQFSDDGSSVNECGGMYVDVAVLEAGDTGEMIAYSVDLEFDKP